jgi:hypothetical protein
MIEIGQFFAHGMSRLSFFQRLLFRMAANGGQKLSDFGQFFDALATACCAATSGFSTTLRSRENARASAGGRGRRGRGPVTPGASEFALKLV